MTDPLDDDVLAVRQRLTQSVGLLSPTRPPLAEIERRIGRRRRQRMLVAGGSISGAAAAVVAVILVVTLLGNGTNRGVRTVHTPSPSPSSRQPSPSASSSAPVPAGLAGGPLPKDFRPISVSMVDAESGWVLGRDDEQCATATSARCVVIARTTDGGRTWLAIAAPDGVTTGYEGCPRNIGPYVAGPCVDGLVFADALNGYLYSDRAMFMTADGGATWQRVAGRHDGGAYTVVVTTRFAARLPARGDCDVRCDSAVEVAPLGSNVWHDVTPHAANAGLLNADLVARGATLALWTDAHGGATTALFLSSDGGQNWVAQTPDVCARAGGENHFFSRSDIGLDGSIAGICGTGTPTSPDTLVISSDHGATFLPSRVPGYSPEWVAVLSRSHLVVVARDTELGTGEVLLASLDGGKSWHKTQAIGDTTYGAPYFMTATAGFITTFTVSGYLLNPSVWVTNDAGETWVQRAIH